MNCMAMHLIKIQLRALPQWVEIPTCVGVRLEQDDSFSFCAPFGLAQNWSLQLQLNPLNPRPELFTQRIQQKLAEALATATTYQLTSYPAEGRSGSGYAWHSFTDQL